MREYGPKNEVSREISKAHEQKGLKEVTNVSKHPLDPRRMFYRLLEERYPEIAVRVEEPGVGIRETKEVPLENYLSVWQTENAAAKAKLALLRSEVMQNPLFPIHRMLERGEENVMEKIRKEIQKFQDLKKFSTDTEAQRLLATSYQMRNEALAQKAARENTEEELKTALEKTGLWPEWNTNQKELGGLAANGIEPYRDEELKELIRGLVEAILHQEAKTTS